MTDIPDSARGVGRADPTEIQDPSDPFEPSEARGDGRSKVGVVVRGAVSVALLGVLVWVADIGAVARSLAGADAGLLVLAGGLFLLDRGVMIAKWLPLLRIQVPDVSALRAAKAYFASSFAAILLPASVGADILRAYGVGRPKGAVLKVAVSVVFERVLGIVGSGIVAVAAVWVAWQASVSMTFLLPWALACIAVGAIAALLPFAPWIWRFLDRAATRYDLRGLSSLLQRFGMAYGMYRGHPWTVVGVGLLSVVEQLIPVFVFWAASLALGFSLPIASLFVAVPLSLFAARLPVSIAGLGVFEGGMAYLLGLFGVSVEHALTLAVVGRGVELVALVPGAFWWRELAGQGAAAESPRTTEGR